MPRLSRSNAIGRQRDYYRAKLLQLWGLDILNQPQMSHFHRPNADIPINILGRFSGLASTFPQNGVWVVNEIVRTKPTEGPINIEEMKTICENLKDLERTTLPIGNFSAAPAPPDQPGPSLLHSPINLAAPSSSPYDQLPTSAVSHPAAIPRDEVTTATPALPSSCRTLTSSAVFGSLDLSNAVGTPAMSVPRAPAASPSTHSHPSPVLSPMSHSAEQHAHTSPAPRSLAQPDLELPDTAENVVWDDVNSTAVEKDPKTASEAGAQSSSPGIGRTESFTNPGEHAPSLPAAAVGLSDFSDLKLPVPLGLLRPPGVLSSTCLLREISSRRYQSQTWMDNYEAFEYLSIVLEDLMIIDTDADADTEAGSSYSHPDPDNGSD